MKRNAPAMAYVFLASVTVQKDTQVHSVLFHYATLWIAVAMGVAYRVSVSANQAGVVMHVTRKNALLMQQVLSATVMVSVLK